MNNNNCTCIIGSKNNKCIVHGYGDVGDEVLRVNLVWLNDMIDDTKIFQPISKEQEIKHLEQVILSQQEKIVELTNQNKILNNQLFGHLKSTHY